MATRPRPVFTENFADNLDSIRSFLGGEGEAAFQKLLDRIFNDDVETVGRFPLIERSFLAHDDRSLEARTWVDRTATISIATSARS